MVHLAIDAMWQVFKFEIPTLRNDFCCIAAKNGILLRLINTLYSLNEAIRFASLSLGSEQSETSLSSIDQHDLPALKNGIIDYQLEPSQSTPHLQKSDVSNHVDDKTQFNSVAAEVTLSEKSPIQVPRNSSVDQSKNDPSQGNISIQTSTDCPPKLSEPAPNDLSVSGITQHEQVRLQMLEKEPPSRRLSRHFSGKMEYFRQFSGFERRKSALPLLISSDKKRNGEVETLNGEFTGNTFFFAPY